MKCLVCSIEGKNLCEKCKDLEIRYGYFVVKQKGEVRLKIRFGVISETDLDSKWMNVANEYSDCEVEIELDSESGNE